MLLKSIERKGENAGTKPFLSFPDSFLLFLTEFIHLSQTDLQSADSFNVDKSKILPC